jgi:hypothetical protein
MDRLKYQVQEMIFDSKSMLDETNFYHQRQGKPSELTKMLTYIMGDYSRQFPITTMTLGGVGYGNKASAIELDDVQFTYPVMGKFTKAAVAGSTSFTSTDKVGVGNGTFKIRFTDNSVKRFFILQSPKGVQIYIHDNGTKVGDEWEYTAELAAGGPETYLPYSEIESGRLWAVLFTGVAESESRSTETGMAMPGSMKNQMGFMRQGMSWAGNSANKVMNFNINYNGKQTNVWMDWFMWQFELRWLMQLEHAAWYSKYNRKEDGTISLKDQLTGKAIPLGSGLLEQITNKSTFSKLSYKGLVNRIGDALFGHSDASGMTITLHTGRGGMREIDRCLREEGIKITTDFSGIADKFVSGTGRNLMLGGFFDGFYHIDGYTIKVKYNPLFDYGEVAQASDRHPETGLPLESYRMVFIDDSDYDGMPNIQRVAQTGRSFLHGVVPGLTPMPKSLEVMTQSFNVAAKDAAPILATEQDKSGYTRFASCGYQMRRGSKCFDLRCVAGQA